MNPELIFAIQKTVKGLTDYVESETNVKYRLAGLCGNYLVDIPNNLLIPIFESWKYFSGNVDFPVGNGVTEYANAVNTSTASFKLHDRATEYGLLRKQLAEHLIIELNKLIGNNHE